MWIFLTQNTLCNCMSIQQLKMWLEIFTNVYHQTASWPSDSTKFTFGRGFIPDPRPRWQSLRCSLDPIASWVGGYPSPLSTPQCLGSVPFDSSTQFHNFPRLTKFWLQTKNQSVQGKIKEFKHKLHYPMI